MKKVFTFPAGTQPDSRYSFRRAPHLRRVLVVTPVLVALVVVLGPVLVRAAAVNAVNIALLRSAASTGTSWLRPEPRLRILWSAERHPSATGAPDALASFSIRLGEAAAPLVPSPQTELALAQIRLNAGEWDAATSALAGTELDALPEPSGGETAYGYQAVRGRAALVRANFTAAAAHLQLAAWLGGDRSREDGTYGQLYQALAGVHAEEAAQDSGAWRPSYLRAKYLDMAGDLAAGDALKALAQGQWADVSPNERADALTRLARYYVGVGDTAKAEETLRSAIAAPVAPAVSYLELAALYRRTGDLAGAAAAMAPLQGRQPTYRLGRWVHDQGRGWVAEPRSVGPDWLLEGYDLDEEALEAGAEIETVLYWRRARAPGETAAEPLMLERRVLRNLVPNAGFEWQSQDGTTGAQPLGYSGGMYHEPIAATHVEAAERMGRSTHVLVLDNEPPVQRTGALSDAGFAVDKDTLYLQAAWRRAAPTARSMVGRSCAPLGSQAGTPFYIAFQDASPAWAYYASVDPPLMEESVATCWAWLTNYDGQGPSYLDDLLITPIAPPDEAAIGGG